MLIHEDIEALPQFKNAVVTFGSFDGVHYGHREIFNRMKDLAHDVDGETVVVTFDPHPRQVIYPNDNGLRLLSSRTEKIALFQDTGIDHLVISPFTIEFSQLVADEYIEKYVLQRFRPHTVIVGYDHRFGLNRTGNIDFLRNERWSKQFSVMEIEQQLVDDAKVSSTKIREHIQDGNMVAANQLLSRPYLLHGKVVEGRRLGAELGFPTANIVVHESLKLLPKEGIYACQVWFQEKRYRGMLYLGNRPTLGEGNAPSIEVNMFDFDQQIYGRDLMLEVLDFIRPDETFADLELLKKQLAKDKESALHILERAEAKREVAIVILNYNGRAHLEAFLPSVIRSLGRGQSLIVADNGSDDDSIAWLKQNHPQVEILALEQNSGFAGGYNNALPQIDAQYIVLLNSDVEVTTGWLEPLIRELKFDNALGACQPKIKSYTHKDQFEYAGAGGGLIDQLGYPFCQGRIMSTVEQDQGQYDETREVFWVSGAAMCLRRDVFIAFGGFDADYFAHMEEIDLCWRMKRAGYKVKVIPKTTVYHLGGGTLSYKSPRKTYLNFRNNLSTLVKNERGSRLLWLLPGRILLDWVASLHFLLAGESANFLSVWRAHGYLMLRLRKLIGKRRSIKKQIQSLQIGPDNTAIGRYEGSIVYEFFLRGKKTYHDLNKIQSHIEG